MSETTTPAWFEDGGRAELPAWFDAAVHHAGDGGIFETATGILLAGDGLPVSAALRTEREAMAASVERAEATSGRGRSAAPVAPPAAAPQE